jgi:hypothetical protein
MWNILADIGVLSTIIENSKKYSIGSKMAGSSLQDLIPSI